MEFKFQCDALWGVEGRDTLKLWIAIKIMAAEWRYSAYIHESKVLLPHNSLHICDFTKFFLRKLKCKFTIYYRKRSSFCCWSFSPSRHVVFPEGSAKKVNAKSSSAWIPCAVCFPQASKSTIKAEFLPVFERTRLKLCVYKQTNSRARWDWGTRIMKHIFERKTKAKFYLCSGSDATWKAREYLN